MADEPGVLSACVRSNLRDADKLDKRKQATSDIESDVRKLLRDGSYEHIQALIRELVEEFCVSAFPSRRKGGLSGLASVAIGLEHQQVQRYVSEIVPPVLICFSDEDPHVRYSACEAFYNVAKVARGGILEHFSDVFDGLCKLYVDVDPAVKDGAQCLDRLVRDIVTERRNFDYAKFIPMLTTRIRVLSPFIRQLVLGWIVLLDSVPQVDMIAYLPEYLEGLFGILASDNRDMRSRTEACLTELLQEIKSGAAERPARAQQAVTNAAKTVAKCCCAGEHRPEDNYVRLTALHWLLEFVRLQTELESAPHLHEFASETLSLGPRCVSGGLQLGRISGGCVAHAGIGGTHVSGGLRQLVPVLLKGALHCLDDGESEIRQNAEQANSALRSAAIGLGADLPVEDVAEAVFKAMHSDRNDAEERSAGVVLKCLGWLQLLLVQCPSRVLQLPVRDRLVDVALSNVLRQEDDVAIAVLRLLADLVAKSDDLQLPRDTEAHAENCGDLFTSMCQRLFRLMAADGSVLVKRGELVVRKLCDGVDADRFFATAARSVAQDASGKFTRDFVRVLNRVLLTSRETRLLRAKLWAEAAKSPKPGGVGTADCQVPAPLLDLLVSWFHCPVSTLALSLWFHWFELAAEIAARLALADHTPELQMELEDFAELLDSPVFIRVRLELLDSRRQPALLRTVLGLTALLPKEHMLIARLDFVKTGLLLDRVGLAAANSKPAQQAMLPQETIDLLNRFDSTVDAHGWRKCVT